MVTTALLILLIGVGPFVWMTGVLRAVAASSLESDDARRIVLVAPLAYTTVIAAGMALTLGESVPAKITPVVLLAIVLGVLLYLLDTTIRTRLAGDDQSEGTPPASVGVLSVLGVVPEELLYRWGLSLVLAGIHPALFVAVSAAVFGLHHYESGYRLPMVLKAFDGLVYALLFVWTGSILAPILCHAAYNLSFLALAVDWQGFAGIVSSTGD